MTNDHNDRGVGGRWRVNGGGWRRRKVNEKNEERFANYNEKLLHL